MESTIINIISEICGAQDGELELELDLFEAALLDSFAIVQMSVELEEAFGVTLDLENLTREQIATPARIIDLVQELSS